MALTALARVPRALQEYHRHCSKTTTPQCIRYPSPPSPTHRHLSVSLAVSPKLLQAAPFLAQKGWAECSERACRSEPSKVLLRALLKALGECVLGRVGHAQLVVAKLVACLKVELRAVHSTCGRGACRQWARADSGCVLALQPTFAMLSSSSSLIILFFSTALQRFSNARAEGFSCQKRNSGLSV